MKRLIALVLAIVVICGCFAGCNGSTSGTNSGGNTGEKYKIGVLAPAVTHGWVAGVAYYAQARCKELESEGKIEYKILTSNNAEEMTNQIDDLKTWGAQAVVAFPQWEGMEAPIQELVAGGVHVVNFDIVIEGDGIYRVSGDNEDMGTQSAQYIVDKIGDTGTVIMLNNPSSGSVSELRQKGFEEKMAQIAPNMEVTTYATGDFTRETGQKVFADILLNHDHIDAVFSMDDESTIGVINAIKEANRTDIQVVTGGGGMQEYFKMMSEEKDIWLQSALYSPVMVQDAVDNALALCKGETVEEVKIIPTTIVDRDNCADYLDEESPY